MDSDYENILDESDDEYYHVIVRVSRVRRFQTRKCFDYWDDVDFYTRFRMSKQCCSIILEQIRPQIENRTNWNNALSAECMLLLTLRFYAAGGFLITTGDLSGVSKTTASRVVKKVSHHIALLRRQYIKFPETVDEKTKVIQEFYNFARFPRVIAAMDCSHVRIQSPGSANGELFRNRKGYFSLNVQTVCDAKLKIMDIVARWPGSSHDSTIFNNSRIRARFETGEFGRNVIVADGGYQCRNYIMTPLRNCTSRAEELYNESQIRTRNCVERSYGVWKRRFPVLATGMRLEIGVIQSIIVATAVLHNLCCLENEREPPPLDDHLENLVNIVNSPDSLLAVNDGNNSRRNILIHEYFSNIVLQNSTD